MHKRLGAKLTCFTIQKYDPAEHIFVLTFHSRAIASFPQDLGRAVVSVLGDTFAVHHRMFLETHGFIPRQLLAHCSSEVAPVITLSILSIYSSTAADIGTLIKSSSKTCHIDILDGAEMPLLDCSSDAPLWPIGPLLIFQPHIVLSPTSLPSFSAIDCVLSFLSFSNVPTYPMHLGTILHNAVQSRFTNESLKEKINYQLSKLKNIWNEMKLDPSEFEQLISISKISANMDDMASVETSLEHTSMENKIIYGLLKNEPTLALQNNDVEFTEALIAIRASNKLAQDVIATQETLVSRFAEYFIEEHVVSTDLGMQGKIDLFGVVRCKETDEIQKKDVIELKITSLNGKKREVHFMQACTYFYATCIEQKANDSTLLGCDVIGIKKDICNYPFQLFGTKQFVTHTELAKRQPHNPVLYFLQMYTVFRATYLLLLELSTYLVAVTNVEDCCIDAAQFIEMLRDHEPKYCFKNADYTPFLDFLFKSSNLNSITMISTQKELIRTLMATHKHITGDLSTPLATLSRLHTVKVGVAHYSFLHLKSGSLKTPGMYRLRFIIAADVSFSQTLGDAHCIASNIFVRALACVSSTLCSQIVLLESSYDLSLVCSQHASGLSGFWVAYPLPPEGPVAGRSLSIIMSSLVYQKLTPEDIVDKIDRKLLNLERSVQRCSLKTLEDAVRGPFYNDSILLLVNKKDSHKLPKDILTVFARRGICTVIESAWPVDFSDVELNGVLTEKLGLVDLLGNITARYTTFAKSLTKMAAVSPVDLLDFPILRQNYGTIFVFTDISNSQDTTDCTAAYSDFYAVIPTLPEYKRMFFIYS